MKYVLKYHCCHIISLHRLNTEACVYVVLSHRTRSSRECEWFSGSSYCPDRNFGFGEEGSDSTAVPSGFYSGRQLHTALLCSTGNDTHRYTHCTEKDKEKKRSTYITLFVVEKIIGRNNKIMFNFNIFLFLNPQIVFYCTGHHWTLNAI